jgi:hypothetical protein
MFVCPDSFLAVPRASGPIFMFCAPVLVFGGIEGVGSHFHVLRDRTRFHVLCALTHFRLYRRRRVPFPCFVLPDSFSAVSRASGLVSMFCPPGLVFGGTKGVGSRFNVLRFRTRFRRCRGRRVPFSCFGAPRLIFGGTVGIVSCFHVLFVRTRFGCTEGLGSHFHVLRARNLFRRYREPRVSFSCFARPDSFSAVPRASRPVFMFCAPGLVFGGTQGVRSRFKVLHDRTGFRRYRGRRVLFSCFARSDSFSAVPRASGPLFMVCAHRLIFSGTEGVGSRFHVLRAWTRFRRYRGGRAPFSCFALLNSFSAVPRASSLVFMFCAPEIFFDGTESVASRFHVLRARTRFRRNRRRQVPF